jgi:hypothetical protein
LSGFVVYVHEPTVVVVVTTVVVVVGTVVVVELLATVVVVVGAMVVVEVPAASWLIWMILPATVIVAVRAVPEFGFTE